MLEKEEHFCTLTIKDSGKGMEKQYLPFIFEMFNQAETGTTRAHGGMGVGLALVKELVESHGGNIYAASEGLGKGSQFTVRLPLLSNVEMEMPDVPDDDIDSLKEVLVGKKVLIVDDDNQFLTAFGELLTSIQGEFVLAESVKSALEKIHAENFDLVISDIAMPGMDGYQLLKEIKSFRASMPVIALTGFNRLEDVNQTIIAGFDAHLGKPVELTELLRTINSFFCK